MARRAAAWLSALVLHRAVPQVHFLFCLETRRAAVLEHFLLLLAQVMLEQVARPPSRLAAPPLRVVLAATSFSQVAVAGKWAVLSPFGEVAQALERVAMFCSPAPTCKCMPAPVLQLVARCLYRLVLVALVAVCRFRRQRRRKPRAGMWLFLRQTALMAVAVSPLPRDPLQLAQVVHCSCPQARQLVARLEMFSYLLALVPLVLVALLL